MESRKGENEEVSQEPASAPLETERKKGKVAIQIQLERADAERLLQDLLGELAVDTQRVDEFVQKQWAASEQAKIAGGVESAAKHKPPSR